MFENEAAARAAFEKAGELDKRIHIAFMDSAREIEWLS